MSSCLLLLSFACGSSDDGEAEAGFLTAATADSSASSASESAMDDDGTSSSADDTTATASTIDTGDSSDGDTDSSTSADTGDTGTSDPIPVCLQPCSSAADCEIVGAGEAYDADNYSCDGGGCVYTGCNSDAECSNLGYVCRQINGGDFSTCVATCSVADDCAIAGAGVAYDADNYACESGGCVYTGCNSDSECASTTPNTGCRDFGNGLTACVQLCSSGGDCGQGQLAYDADNYECVAGYCEYTGCNSDAECMEFSDLICV